jgi:hypothetical protein
MLTWTAFATYAAGTTTAATHSNAWFTTVF